MRPFRASFAVALLTAVMPSRLAAQPHWTLGSPSTAVARAEGRPDFVERLVSLGYEVWHYDRGWVRLSYSDDRVVAWSSPDKALHAELRAGADTSREATFGVGSSRDDVVRLQGTPSALEPNAQYGIVVLRYGSASVRIAATDSRVMGWDDPAHALRTRNTDWDARAENRNQLPIPAAPNEPRHVPTGPPSLRATVVFRDAGDDGILDAEERATVSVTIRNEGRGTAYGIVVALRSDSLAAVDLGRAQRTDSLAPLQQVIVALPIVAARALRDGSARFTVSIREVNGFDADPAARLTVRTRALRPPRLVLDGIAINDQSGNGRIEPRELVDVVARIRNAGNGDARAVRFTIQPGAGISIVGSPARDEPLGTLPSGETRDIRFTAFANSRASSFPVTLVMREERPRFDTTFILPLALDTKLASIPEFTVRGHDAAAPAAQPSLVSDVDTGIPHPRRSTNTIAVVLGVERYERAAPIVHAKRDAAVFREYASALFGTGDDPLRLALRTDDEVTSAEVHRIFDDGGWLSRQVDANTDVIVYYAGHGATDGKTHTSYLLPNDGDPAFPAQSGLALTELYDRLAALRARSVTVFLESAFPDGARDAGSAPTGSRGVVLSLENPALRAPSMAVFSATTAQQTAGSAPAQRHGLFTYWLLAGLRGAADTDGDGAITVGELDAFISSHISRDAARLDREQQPFTVARDKQRVVVRYR